MKTAIFILTFGSALLFTACNNEPVQTASPQTGKNDNQSNQSDSSVSNNRISPVNNANSNPANQSDQMVPDNTGPKTPTANP